ncbi:MAG: ATP-binding protein [Limnochordaceae bacterium]|nr:ATP-binding protein [Limnochordaceae bacterium]
MELTPQAIAAEKAVRVKELERDAGISRRYQWATLDALEPSEAVEAARQWVEALPEPTWEPISAGEYVRRRYGRRFVVPEDDAPKAWPTVPDIRGGGLLLVGPPGTGKTTFAVAMLRAAMARTLACGAFWPVADLLDALRPREDRTARVRIDELVRLPLLVLDDLGVERPTEWGLEQLDRLIDGRYREEGPLIVTANLARKQLANAVGERIASRLAEMTQPIMLAGPDRRLAAREAA